MISSSESGNVEISHDFRCVKHFADRRTVVCPCCIMSKTIAVHVRYNFLYISLPSSAKQQREMTKFCAFYGTWTTTANFSHRSPKRNVSNGGLWLNWNIRMYGDQEYDIYLIKFVQCMCNFPTKDSWTLNGVIFFLILGEFKEGLNGVNR